MGIFDKDGGSIFGNKGDEEKERKSTPGDFPDAKAGTTPGAAAPRTGAPRADFSDVTSGASTEAPAAGSSSGSTYTVQSGDSLSKIAKEKYGDASQWKRIYEANKDKIKNPDLIYPGQEFTIPGS